MQHSLDRELVILLSDVARLFRTRADKLARTHGMTRAQWVILTRLDRAPGLSQNELAALCEVEPITVGRLVDRLETRGLLERRVDPSDRRIRRLFLRPKARPLLNEMNGYRHTLSGMLMSGVSDAEKNALIDTLIRMKSNLGCKSAEIESTATAAE